MLFSAPMVLALLDGRKTQTRRIVKPQPVFQGVECFGDSWKWQKGKDWFSGVTTEQLVGYAGLCHEKRCPHPVESRIWCREAWCVCLKCSTTNFRATVNKPRNCQGCDESLPKWKSPIFMPRWASRITLEVTAVKCELLQDISEQDCESEGSEVCENPDHGFISALPGDMGRIGCPICGHDSKNWAVNQYIKLWEKINGEGSWDKNPWVWVYSFTVIK